MEPLSAGQFGLVYSSLSLAVAALAGAFVYFLGARSRVGERYRPALWVVAAVVAVAAYHHVRILEAWTGAFGLQDGVYVASGQAFGDTYQYAVWLVTVPLLLLEAVAVLALAPAVARPVYARLVAAALVMIGLGFSGEVSGSAGARFGWGMASAVPFVYILHVLWAELGEALETQPERVRSSIGSLRLLLLTSWGIYAASFLVPMLGIDGATALVSVQVGYTVADLLAKPAVGLLIFRIARAKTEADAAELASGELARAA